MLLHGLTFDRRQWDPVRRELAVLDPARQVLAVDLPGHGDSPRLASYRMTEVAAVVHDQVTEAGLTDPVVVGHSVGAVVATTYAARHPVRGVVNLDQILLPGPFGAVVRQAEPTLRGPEWRRVWDGMLAGMGIESLPTEAREIVTTATDPGRTCCSATGARSCANPTRRSPPNGSARCGPSPSGGSPTAG
ncbi:alpha/beta hydrolase [Micromonospora sp. M12]